MKLKSQPFINKLGIAVALDLADFTLFRVPGIGTIYDLAVAGVMYEMIGWEGLLAAWEVIEPSDQVDAEIPSATATLLLAEYVTKKK